LGVFSRDHPVEGKPMRNHWIITGSVLVLALASVPPALSQEPTLALAAPSCVSDWGCWGERPPLGFYVQAVTDGGRYVTLEDGSVWEVEISDRATSAAWTPEDFVSLHRIGAPRENYEFELSRVGMGEQRVAARLAGRQPAAYRSDSTSTRQE
jgi:hypothetical protein